MCEREGLLQSVFLGVREGQLQTVFLVVRERDIATSCVLRLREGQLQTVFLGVRERETPPRTGCANISAFCFIFGPDPFSRVFCLQSDRGRKCVGV